MGHASSRDPVTQPRDWRNLLEVAALAGPPPTVPPDVRHDQGVTPTGPAPLGQHGASTADETFSGMTGSVRAVLHDGTSEKPTTSATAWRPPRRAATVSRPRGPCEGARPELARSRQPERRRRMPARHATGMGDAAPPSVHLPQRRPHPFGLQPDQVGPCQHVAKPSRADLSRHRVAGLSADPHPGRA